MIPLTWHILYMGGRLSPKGEELSDVGRPAAVEIELDDKYPSLFDLAVSSIDMSRRPLVEADGRSDHQSSRTGIRPSPSCD